MVVTHIQIYSNYYGIVWGSTMWRETFEVENFHGSVRSEHFVEKKENFRGILNQLWVGMARPKFCGFMGGSQTAKFQKFSVIRYMYDKSGCTCFILIHVPLVLTSCLYLESAAGVKDSVWCTVTIITVICSRHICCLFRY